jgi:hypothetical protein
VLTLSENRNEVTNLAILLLVLSAFGLLSGAILARGEIRKSAIEGV